MKAFENYNYPEMNYWQNSLLLKSATRFHEKEIITGKRIGRKLGIPTANVQVKIEEVKKFQMIPGIYVGKTKVKKFTNPDLKQFENQSLPAIVSFGFNPQYN